METNNQIVQIKIEDIVPNRFQPRLNFKEDDLTDLATSIKQYGIIQPLIVRPLSNKYEIIAGERRYRAATMVGLKTVPAIISNIDDQTSAELAIVENIQRQNLNAVEEAKSYKKLLDLGQMTQEQLAERMGKKQTTISNKIRLLNLPQEVQKAVLEGKISERHARSLLSVHDSNLQKEILNKIVSEKLTVKATESLIKEKMATKPEDSLAKSNNSEPTINLNKLNNPTISKNNIFKVTGDDNMNQPNYNDLMQQPAMPIPETPIPEQNTEKKQQPTNSIFNNNFFPSLEDEKTNMSNLNPWSTNNQPEPTNAEPVNQTVTMPNPLESTGLSNTVIEPSNVVEPNTPNSNNPWTMPNEPTMQAPEPSKIVEPSAPNLNNPWTMSNEPTMQTPEPSKIVEPNTPNLNNPWTMPNEPTMQAPEPSKIVEPSAPNLNNPWTMSNEPTMQTPEPSKIVEPSAPNLNNPWTISGEPTMQAPEPSKIVEPSAPNLNNPWNVPSEPTSQTPEPTNALTFNQQETNPWNNQTTLNSGSLPNFVEQPLPTPINTTIPEAPTSQPKVNINDSINKVRQVIAEIENSGSKVQSSEVDMDTEYQIIIKIQKAN